MKHTLEFKEQILKEIEEVGNVSLVCKRHGLKSRTEHGWLNKDRNKIKIAESKQTQQHLKKIKDLSASGRSSNFFVKKNLPTLEQRKTTVLEFRHKRAH